MTSDPRTLRNRLRKLTEVPHLVYFPHDPEVADFKALVEQGLVERVNHGGFGYRATHDGWIAAGRTPPLEQATLDWMDKAEAKRKGQAKA